MTGHGGDEHETGGRPQRRRTPGTAGGTGASAGHLPAGRRALAWVAVGLATVLVAGVIGVYAAYRDVFDQINRVHVSGLGRRPPGYDHSLNLLIIGSDTRRGRNSRFGPHIAGQRSDTVLVLHIAPGFRRAVVLSLPRDSVVPVLACPPDAGAAGQAAQPGQVEQLNQTFADGGPGCLWKTIEQATHIRLDHFLELNFTGFEAVINDLGGVRICLPYPINDPHSKLHLSRGLHHVMGAQALAYWRVRYIGVGSDLERIARDQYLMAAVAQAVKHADLLGDPARVFRLMSDIASSLTTDDGLSQPALVSLALGLRNIALRSVRFVQAPTSAYPANPNWVVWSAAASALFSVIAHDRKMPRPARKVPRNWRSPSSHPGRTARPSRPAGHEEPAGGQPPSPSGVTRRAGGITAGANVCHDSGAFAGPLGGH